MITLITGVPGSGKTVQAVDILLDMVGTRPVFADGVPELKIEHQPCPPVNEWTEHAEDKSSATGTKVSFTFPPNSIVIIDECQRVFRPRNASAKVPDEVAAFETHRHLGIDFILITQHPTLLDANIKRLVGRHIHVRVTALGRYRYEWQQIGDPDSKASRELAHTTRYKLPKRAFSQYKSAELHTRHKTPIPKAVWVILLCVLALGGMGYYIKGSMAKKFGPAKLDNPTGQPVLVSSQPAQTEKVLTAKEYVEQFKPRITGLLHTAPAYDQVTKPVEAPIPIGCVERKKTGDCRCYDQQGNHYQTTPAVCKTVLEAGIFFAWKKSGNDTLAAKAKANDSAPSVLSLKHTDQLVSVQSVPVIAPPK